MSDDKRSTDAPRISDQPGKEAAVSDAAGAAARPAPIRRAIVTELDALKPV